MAAQTAQGECPKTSSEECEVPQAPSRKALDELGAARVQRHIEVILDGRNGLRCHAEALLWGNEMPKCTLYVKCSLKSQELSHKAYIGLHAWQRPSEIVVAKAC